MKPITKETCTHLFYLLCGVHLFFWTLIPFLIRGTLPFDTVMAIALGKMWLLGYVNTPPLSAWLTAIFYKLMGVLGVYLLAQLMILTTFWAIWRLAQRYSTPAYALLSVALLEGKLSVSYVSPNFNPTAIMLPLWALTFLYFYDALKKGKLSSWVIVGVLILNLRTIFLEPLLPMQSLRYGTNTISVR